jgi:type II secretory pathway pseudopilin PulG
MKKRPKLDKQRGYVLLAVMLIAALILIALAIAAPRIGQQIKREKEEELIHRGQEYSNAIKKFYRANNGLYPSSLDQLENTNNKRFLRKRYIDPMTGKDDWKIIHAGEAHLDLSTITQPPTSGGNTSGQSAGSDQIPVTPPNTTQPNNPQPGNVGLSGSPTQGSGGQFGGGPAIGGQIIGVASSSKNNAIKELKGKTHYNEWEFVYDPRFDKPGGKGVIGTPPPGTSPPATSPPVTSPPVTPGLTGGPSNQ